MKKNFSLFFTLVLFLLFAGCVKTEDNTIEEKIKNLNKTYELTLYDEPFGNSVKETLTNYYKQKLSTRNVDIELINNEKFYLIHKHTKTEFLLKINEFYSLSFDKNYFKLLNPKNDFYLKDTQIEFEILQSLSKVILNQTEYTITGNTFQFRINTKTVVSAISEITPFAENININKALELMNSFSNDPNFIIIDVRTPSERNDGFIKNSININYYDNFKTVINILDKNKIYLIYCRSGNRSANAMRIMKDEGFNFLYNLLGGFTKWKNDNKPYEK